MKCLDLSESYNIDDEGAVAIFSASVKSRSLKSLNLSLTDIQSSGWVKGFQVMLDFELTLEELILEENGIDDIGAALLFEVLGVNKSLIALNMQMNESITSAGWVACFRLLLHSGFALKKLFLDWNNIDDEGAAMLVELLASNKTMNVLTLGGNNHISIDGWYRLADILHPTSLSTLKELTIGNYWDEPSTEVDELVLYIAEMLKINTKLEVLDFWGYANLSPICWNALSKAFCDESSIVNTCLSNHTLRAMEDDKAILDGSVDEELPSSLRSLLKMNHKANKGDVVRDKIVTFCLTDDTIVGAAFADAATTSMPSVIGCIGKNRLGFSAMFHLVRSMPWLVDSNV